MNNFANDKFFYNMYSSEDFENFYVRYKAEGLPQGMTIQTWCIKNKVSWNLFNKWYRDTRHRIVPVEVTGNPEDHDSNGREAQSEGQDDYKCSGFEEVNSLRIMVDIRMSNGMQIRQRNLSYERLRKLVENMEGLC